MEFCCVVVKIYQVRKYAIHIFGDFNTGNSAEIPLESPKTLPNIMENDWTTGMANIWERAYVFENFKYIFE